MAEPVGQAGHGRWAHPAGLIGGGWILAGISSLAVQLYGTVEASYLIRGLLVFASDSLFGVAWWIWSGWGSTRQIADAKLNDRFLALMGLANVAFMVVVFVFSLYPDVLWRDRFWDYIAALGAAAAVVGWVRWRKGSEAELAATATPGALWVILGLVCAALSELVGLTGDRGAALKVDDLADVLEYALFALAWWELSARPVGLGRAQPYLALRLLGVSQVLIALQLVIGLATLDGLSDRLRFEFVVQMVGSVVAGFGFWQWGGSYAHRGGPASAGAAGSSAGT